MEAGSEMSDVKRDSESALAELCALLRLLRCESRELFQDRGVQGVFATFVGESALLWALFDPPEGSDRAQCDLMWSVAEELSEHRFEESAKALSRLERRLREGLGELSREEAKAVFSGLPGSRAVSLPGQRWRRQTTPSALADGAVCWSRISAPFEPRSTLFREALSAFDREGLIQGGGKALMESVEIEEQVGPARGSSGGAKGL